MKADGSDCYPISWHETSEVNPSVDNNGMIVYTRWDYVDRAFHTAHHLWISWPDGRDPRAPHGNYPRPLTTIGGTPYGDADGDGRGLRPWAEYNIRAIPNTTKYVTIAGRHHDAPGGEPVIIDLSVRDDNAMSQVKVLRPACCLPNENERGTPNCPSGCNGPCNFMYTPWPLSEEYFLIGSGLDILLIDKSGNTEKMYTAPLERHGDFQPEENPGARYMMPLRPRTKPSYPPDATWQGERSDTPDHKRATLGVLNVYQSDMPLPANTKIKEIRVVGLTPRPWGAPIKDEPRMGYSEGAQGRMALGAAAVEEDGSAYFEAPVGQLIYFQALDEKGMAVQSMRSGTYVHPGEQLQCIGCHEDKWQLPSKSTSPPLAFQRPPSSLKPEPEGSNPLTFARLVQPTFNNKCGPCHRDKNVDVDLSYWGLQGRAFFFDSFTRFFDGGIGGSRTIPGRCGARESGLGKALLDKHLDRITTEELRRVTLWLDCNSMELAAYTGNKSIQWAVDEQRAGRVVWPEIDIDPSNPTGVEKDRPLPGSGTVIETLRQRGFLAAAQGLSLAISGSHFRLDNPAREAVTVALFDCNGRALYSIATRNVSLSRSLVPADRRPPAGLYVLAATATTANAARPVYIVGR
jgi:hypothetical protein